MWETEYHEEQPGYSQILSNVLLTEETKEKNIF